MSDTTPPREGEWIVSPRGTRWLIERIDAPGTLYAIYRLRSETGRMSATYLRDITNWKRAADA